MPSCFFGNELGSGYMEDNPGSLFFLFELPESPRPLYYHQSLTWKSPRLIQVFWLWRLWAFSCKITLLVTILTNGLSGIFLRLSASTSTSTRLAFQGVCCINSSGRGGILRRFFLVVSLPFLFFLLLFASLLGGLSAIGVLRSCGLLFLGPGLRFFNPWVFHWLTLGTGFGCWRPTTPKAVLIGVANIKAKLEGGLGFSVDGFFDYFSEAIKLSAALLYFDLHWRPETFLEVLNHCTFLWGTIWVKFNQDRL